MLLTGSGGADIPALTAGERCVLAISKTVASDDEEKVRESISSSVAEWLTLEPSRSI